jgi:pimeloyl-ACP methyl ester carboxylesterase
LAAAGAAVRLRHGRRLGFSEYGDPAGRPVLFLHGTPGSRLTGRVLHEQARGARARLITPERPGYGLSDYWSARTAATWSAFAAGLLDELRLDHVPVLGVSGGGPYALAFGSLLPERVSTVGVVGGVCLPEHSCGLRGRSKRLHAVGRASERLLAVCLRVLIRDLRRRPERVAARLGAELARQGVEHPWGGRLLLNDFVEALAHGTRGFAADIARLGRWGFKPEDVGVPVLLWHGESDDEIGVAAARALAERLPACGAHFLAGEGHLGLLPRHGAAIVRALLAEAGRQPPRVEQVEPLPRRVIGAG